MPATKKSVKLLIVEEKRNYDFSVLVGRGYLRHADSDWYGLHSQWYQMYFIIERCNQEDATKFAYDESYPVRQIPAADSKSDEGEVDADGINK